MATLARGGLHAVSWCFFSWLVGRRTSHFIHDGWIHSCSVDSGDDGITQLPNPRRQIEAAGGVDCFRRDVCCAGPQFLSFRIGSGLPAPILMHTLPTLREFGRTKDGRQNRRLVLCSCALPNYKP